MSKTMTLAEKREEVRKLREDQQQQCLEFAQQAYPVLGILFERLFDRLDAIEERLEFLERVDAEAQSED